MISLGPLTTMIVPVLISIYTVNFGRWAWHTKNYRGAIGLFILAGLSTLVPFWLILRAF